MKKKIPIAIIRLIEKITEKNFNLIRAANETDAIIVFREKNDDESNFFFRIESINVDKNGQTSYTLEYIPSNSENLNSLRHTNTPKGLINDLTIWINLINEYNKISPIFDDPISQRYYDDLEADFKIIDDDAYFAPYSFKQQEELQKFLDFTITTIQKNINTETNKEAQSLIKEIVETKENISKSTKAEIINRIRRIIAKAYKLRYEIGKDLMVSFLADAIKQIGSSIVQNIILP